MCHHTLGIVQNMIEGAGMTTIAMTLKPELTEQMNVPRAAHLKFPYGFSVGPAFDPEYQKTIIRDVLSMIPIIKEPGKIVKLPYRWAGRKVD